MNQNDPFAEPGIVAEAAISTATGTVNPFEFPSAADTEDFGTYKEAPGQRQLPHPESKKPTWYTRASKFASTISDAYMLTEWKIAMAVIGVTKNRDLYGLGASFDLPDEEYPGWWMDMAALGHKGMDRAKAMKGAHEGTTIHAFTENVERGRMRVKDVPPEWRPHVEAYLRLHRVHGMETATVESLVLNQDVHNGVCGRLDRLRRCADGTLIVDDLKTGRNAPMGLDEIGIQLAVYAYAGLIFDTGTGLYTPMPEEVRRDVAVVSHVPLNNPDGAELIPIDIERGWAGAQLAAAVREYRNSAKRKRNGIRLPIQALDFEPTVEVVSVVTDYAERIRLAESKEELSSIYLEAVAADLWTVELETLGQAKLAELKGSRPRLRALEGGLG